MFEIEAQWYRSSLTFFTLMLVPLSWLFGLIVACRRFFQQRRSVSFPVPIIVVGNITLGGTGKTPLVIWLAHFLRANGYRPGIVSRGVGGSEQSPPRFIHATSDVCEVGDEAILLQRLSQSPVVVSKNRVAAVQNLLAHSDCNIVISDDGLQHYFLARDLEIALIDGLRGLGNKQLLPAGPLREPIHRLNSVDFVVIQGEFDCQLKKPTVSMRLHGEELVCLKDLTQRISIEHFPIKKVHAVAAIGNPARFFSFLREKGLSVIEHRFPDHYSFKAVDLEMGDDLPIIMTEKDAVKCEKFAKDHHWFFPVSAEIELQWGDILLKKIKSIIKNNKSHRSPECALL